MLNSIGLLVIIIPLKTPHIKEVGGHFLAEENVCVVSTYEEGSKLELYNFNLIIPLDYI